MSDMSVMSDMSDMYVCFYLILSYSEILSVTLCYLLTSLVTVLFIILKKGFAGNRTRATRTQSGYFTT